MLRGTIICENLSKLAYILLFPTSYSDSNCVQIISPSEIVVEDGCNFGASERLGNVSKEAAKVMASFMDNENLALDEFNTYDVDFKFVCVLTENLNHRAAGYTIDILVYSANSAVWTDVMLSILHLDKMEPSKLEIAQ